MKSLKSKQNIAILMLTGIICLIIVGYALLTAYNTKISRSSAVQSSSSSVSQSSASSFYETLTLASSYSYNHLDFDNPFNNSKISTPITVNDYNIEVVGTCENEPYYLAGSECYIYIKCQITDNLNVTQSDNLLNELNSNPVEFWFDGYRLSTPSGDGAYCWDNFCKWSEDAYSPCLTLNGSRWTGKDNNEDYGTNCFYLAVRTILPSTTGYHQIEVKYKGNTFCSFSINVKNERDLPFNVENAPSINEANNQYYSNNITSKSDSKYIEFSQANPHESTVNMNTSIIEEDSATLGEAINTELIKLHDFIHDDARYSTNCTSMDLKAFLLYPEDGYSISTGQYIELEGVHKCDDEDTTKCDSEHKNYYQFNSSAEHIIPTDMSCLKQEGDKYYYVVKELVFNEWCPTGYVWFVIYHYYEVQPASVDTDTTDEQQDSGLPLSDLYNPNNDLNGFIGGFDYIYVENAKVYTYIALNVEAGDESKLENQLGNVTAKFTIKDENGNTLVNENNGIKCEVFDDDYTSYQDTTNVLKEDDGTYTVLLSLGWVTPEVDDDSMTVNVTIELDGDLSGIDNPYKDTPLEITIYDTDFIDEYKKIEEKCGVELSDSTLFDFENATKEIFDDFGVSSNTVNKFKSSKTGQVLYGNGSETDCYKNKTVILSENALNGSSYEEHWWQTIDGEKISLNGYNNQHDLISPSYDDTDDKLLPGDEVYLHNPNITIHGKYMCCDEKVIVLYPEYDYNMAFGNLFEAEQISNSSSEKKYTLTMSSTPNSTLKANHQDDYHTIPLWWNESEYTIIKIVFNDWSPIGQTHWIETVTYTNVDKDGSILDDWYITRNVE